METKPRFINEETDITNMLDDIMTQTNFTQSELEYTKMVLQNRIDELKLETEEIAIVSKELEIHEILRNEIKEIEDSNTDSKEKIEKYKKCKCGFIYPKYNATAKEKFFCLGCRYTTSN